MAIKKFKDFTGWLNLNQPSQIEDNELTIAKNVFYNNAKQLQSRRGYTTFWDQIGSNPITSYFFFQRDDNLDRIAVCHAGNNAYAFDWTNWSSIASNLQSHETIPGLTDNRTRWDYAVYKNVIYMCDWVNPYAKYDGTTYSEINITNNGTCTFDNSTDYVEDTGSSLSDNDTVYFTNSWGALPAELEEYRVYYVKAVDADNFQLTTSPWGTAIDFTDDGTGTTTYFVVNEPRCRYIQYLGDRLYWAGDDANPSTLYYTNAAPTNWENINQNSVVVGWDEQGRINGLNEYSQIVLAFKDSKVYGVNVATPSADPVDSQTGGYADRTIHVVGNSMAYFNERGVDTLQRRSGVDWVAAIESEPLSERVRELIKMIEEKQYNSGCAWYIKKLNNYYFSFDTDNDNRPDTTLVYNSTVGAWTQYTYPALYDYGYYINSSWEFQYLFASASGGQMYQMEYGFDDDWVTIDTEAQTKPRDFNDPAQEKMFEFIDVTWYKQEWWEVEITPIIDWDASSIGTVTDSQLDLDEPSGVLGVDALGINPLGVKVWDSSSDLPMYKFTVRIPFYVRGSNIAVNIKASGTQWILDKIRVGVEWEVFTIFWYDNIL